MSAYLLPSFKYVPFLPRVSFDAVQALVRGYLLPERLHPMHDGLSPIHRDRLLRKDAYRHLLSGVCDVADVLVLICGHGGRRGWRDLLGTWCDRRDSSGCRRWGVASRWVSLVCHAPAAFACSE